MSNTDQVVSLLLTALNERRQLSMPSRVHSWEWLQFKWQPAISSSVAASKLAQVGCAWRDAVHLWRAEETCLHFVSGKLKHVPAHKVVTHVAQHYVSLQTLILRSGGDHESDPLAGAAVLVLSTGCPELLEISLGGCDVVSDTAVASLVSHLPGLKRIWLDRAGCGKYTGTASRPRQPTLGVAGAMAVATSCSLLECLSLCYKQIHNTVICGVAANCPLLTTLHLYHSQVDGYRYVSDLNQVTGEYRGRLQALDDAALVALAAGCRLLEDVVFEGCTELTDAGIITLVQACPRLRKLSLKRSGEQMWHYSRDDVSTFPQDHPTQHLITDASLVELARRCPLVEELCLECCFPAPYTDVGMIAVARGCQLKRLDVERCPKLSDATLLALRSCTHLVWLNIEDNVRHGDLTAKGVKSLLLHKPQLVLGSMNYDVSLEEYLEAEAAESPAESSDENESDS